MKILILGAGATGQVYGRAFNRAGVEVSYFIRASHLEEVQKGFVFYDYEGRSLSKASREQGFSFYSDLEQVGAVRWDYVFFSISSVDLYQPEIDHFIKVILKPETLFISIQPGVEDDEYLSTLIPAVQIVALTVSFMAFRVPFKSEAGKFEPGLALYLPWFSVAKASSKSPKLSSIIQLLCKGGIKTKNSKDARAEMAIPDAILNCFVSTLENADWSLPKLIHDHQKMNHMVQE